jgi:hypothetical protein
MDTNGTQRSSNRTLYIVPGVVGGVLLLGCLGCVGLLGLGWYTARQAVEKASQQLGAERAAEVFLADLSSGNAALAYQRTSAAFQGRRSLEQFRDFINQHPALQNQRPPFSIANTVQGTPSGVTVSTTITDSQGMVIRATIELVQERGQWKVDRFTIP